MPWNGGTGFPACAAPGEPKLHITHPNLPHWPLQDSEEMELYPKQPCEGELALTPEQYPWSWEPGLPKEEAQAGKPVPPASLFPDDDESGGPGFLVQNFIRRF